MKFAIMSALEPHDNNRGKKQMEKYGSSGQQKVDGISEGEVELEIYRMIGEQIRTKQMYQKKWEDIYMHVRGQTTQELVEKLIRNNDGLRHPGVLRKAELMQNML